MLHQVIEVILESLLVIKKTLIDVSLKTSIYMIDMTKAGSNITPETLLIANQMSYMPSRSATLTPGLPPNLRSPLQINRNSALDGGQ
jgi:hypothetical protein